MVQLESSPGPQESPLEGGPPSGQGVSEERLSRVLDDPAAGPMPREDVQVNDATQKQDSSQAQQPDQGTKKEKRGSIVAAPIPISSPAIGSGVVLAGGYIFPLRKSDKVSQPSTIGTAVLITDNGSRGWGLGGRILSQTGYLSLHDNILPRKHQL